MDEADNDIEKLKEILIKESNFDELQEKLKKFASQAPFKRLEYILDSIKIGYENQQKLYINTIDMKSKKLKSPQTFAEEVARYESKIKEYSLLLTDVSNKLKTEYTGMNAKWVKELNNIETNLKERLAKCDSFDKLRQDIENIEDE